MSRLGKGRLIPGAAERGAGRPSSYKVEFQELAANLAAGGATDVEIAQALEISPTTLYRWRHEHPEFRKALSIGKEVADDRVEMSLYHRAIGYSHPAVKVFQHKGEPVIVPYTEHHPPDLGAITLWLANRRSDQWKPIAALARAEEESTPIAQELSAAIERAEAARAKIAKRLPPSRVQALIEAERQAKVRGGAEAIDGTAMPVTAVQGAQDRHPARPRLNDLLAQVNAKRALGPSPSTDDRDPDGE